MKSFLILSIACTALFISACTPTRGVRGNLVEDFRLSRVTPGVSTQADVMNTIGSPTATDPFDQNIWYYMGQKTEKKGILDPKITEERIIRVTFDPKTRIVSEIAPMDTQRNDIPLEKRVTPTSGNDLNAVQQMIGNIGKFNKSSQKASPTDMR